MFSILYFRHPKCMFLGWSTVFTPHLNNTRFYWEEEEVLSKRKRRYICSDSFQMPVHCLILLHELCKVKNTTTGLWGREYFSTWNFKTFKNTAKYFLGNILYLPDGWGSVILANISCLHFTEPWSVCGGFNIGLGIPKEIVWGTVL